MRYVVTRTVVQTTVVEAPYTRPDMALENAIGYSNDPHWGPEQYSYKVEEER